MNEEPKYEPTKIQLWWSRLSMNQRVGTIAGAAAGLLLIIIIVIAVGAGSGGGNSGPALTPGSATGSQICQSAVGNGISNSNTGQNTGLTIESATFEGHNSDAADNAAEGNGVVATNSPVQCRVVYSDGTGHEILVTLFPNGSTGWHAEN